ncbi:glycoside hydrolase family 44 protein [Amycolatopsis sp. NPDC059657]|uniref:glycoside hydrolase family 44 protein n=1 Tax=Amycolatopsis sp. NPDC059657 TaxID=3346899 RepID=UPI00366CA492
MLTGQPATAAAAGPALSVDVSAARHAISAGIYGLNGGDRAFNAEIGQSVARWGGNATSRYNFKNHTYNTGSDWYFENIVADEEHSVEGQVRSNLDRGIKPVVTVPLIGWVAKDSPSSHPFTCGYPATRFPQQDRFDEWDPNCGNGQLDQKNLTGVPADTSIEAGPAFAGEMVSHLVDRFGTAAQGGVPIYELDNEPVLWAHTHRDVHPGLVGYDELGGKGTATAAAIKAADPSAAVLGPSGWGYCEWVASGVDGCGPGADAAAHGGLTLSEWYLKNMKDYSDAHGGKRYLDYFDQHFYPQISGDKDPKTNALRLRSTRSLWDPTYVEETWIGPGGVNAPPLQYIRKAKSWIDKYNPGTKTAITEYNWGALDDINGALAQADVLGIFGREGLDLATMWGEPKPADPGAYAFRMYRNYDGAGGRFGDVSVSATAADQDQLAVYAAQRSADKALTVMVVNKTGGDLTSPLSVAGFDGAGAAQRFTYGAANLGAITRGADLPVSNGRVDATYPANSITLLVLPAAGCSASLQVNGDWDTGHNATVTVTNDRHTAMTGWQVSWTWPGDQRVTTAWNTTLKQNGAGVVAADAGWNGSIGAGGRTTFGFQANGRAAPLTLTCTRRE